MSRSYPRVKGHRKRPNYDLDGGKNYGKPCIFCGIGTVGEKWVQFSPMRGEDETVRVCAGHWKQPDEAVIKQMKREQALAELVEQSQKLGLYE